MKTLNDKLSLLPTDRKKNITDRATSLINEEMTLRDLRLALKKTQSDLSQQLAISQDGISRLEHRSDLLLSTLNRYVDAMGGHLKLIVEFPDRSPVQISHIANL